LQAGGERKGHDVSPEFRSLVFIVLVLRFSNLFSSLIVLHRKIFDGQILDFAIGKMA
jgi:hypothetical protein